MAFRYGIRLITKPVRNDMRLTQVQVSKLTRINKTTISEIENARFTGSFDIFERLLNAVDLQFEVVEKTHQLPSWDEIEELFADEDD
ncbi:MULTISPECIES: helix-turn-helix transcriptional regulator [Vibrio]|uniref:helix-turn-helix domain-containing protein n=1 Tax=Vibrio TaxID=662 RepID=UPI00107EFC11|nr:helix-turn-helix transcriptional regulator [Vibrio tasmaniensis]